MRVLGGQFQRKELRGPKGNVTRPLTALMRKSIFDRLGGRVVGAEVLDLFAGSGSFGLEALSRGALQATFVDVSEEALSALRDNISQLGVEVSQAEVRRGDAVETARRMKKVGKRYSIVFVDPPFDWVCPDEFLSEIFGVTSEEGLLIIRRHFKFKWPETPPEGKMTRETRYGDSMVRWYLT